jgi:hypothetical protein
MGLRSTIALGVSRRWLCAVQGSARQGRLVIRRTLVEPVPKTLARDEPETLGRWVGQQLRASGFPRGRVVLALAREQLGLKRMAVPTTDPRELPDMTRLAMQRELPFDPSTAIIDFLPVEQGAGATTVVALAVPEPVIEAARRMLKAAGLVLDRISLRAMGVATLVGTAPAWSGRRELAIDVTGDGLEFCVVENGGLRFSRAADFTDGEEPDALAGAVVMETRRTWMSFRVVEDAEGVGGAVLIGQPDVADRCLEPIAELLKVPVALLEAHPLVTCNGEEPGPCWPLAGLLLRPIRGLPTVDLAAPRFAPDVGARKRRLVLAAAGLVVVVLTALLMICLVSLERLRQRDRALAMERKGADAVRIEARRERARLHHLEEWDKVGADWLAHLERVVSLGDPAAVGLEQWSGTLEFRGIRYDEESRVWSGPSAVRIIVQGEARTRDIADDYRARLVESRIYDTETAGADSSRTGGGTTFPFAYVLSSAEPRPPATTPAAAGGGP